MSEEERVRVAIRLRPLLPRERVKKIRSCIRVVPEHSQLILGQDRAFTFDQILGPEADQEAVFNRCIAPLIDSWFQGYNVTVFAYGQTGSGKTYTIEGSPGSSFDSEERGLLPRALEKIFAEIQKNLKDVEVNLGVTYVEIYQEELCDLLHISASPHDLHIREDNKGNTVLVGVREIKIRGLQDALTLLEEGSSARQSAMTKMNVHSSRSHSIFTLRLEEKRGDQYVTAMFRFVDLAGSERAHKTGNKDGRFKESVFINTGLLALGNVISALGDPRQKASHIPYRNSKITRVLKDSLGGNSRTVMLTCLSPSADSFAESHNSLKYANRAKNIRNKPVVNKDPQVVRMEEMQSQIEALKEELIRTQTAGTVGIVSKSTEMEGLGVEDEVVRLKSWIIQAQHLLDVVRRAKTFPDGKAQEVSAWLLSVEQADFLDIGNADGLLPLSKESSSILAQLHSELSRYKSELASDEEIFIEKAMELQSVKDKLTEAKLATEVATSQVHQMHDHNADLQDALGAREAELASLEEMLDSHRALLREQEQALLLKDREMLEQRDAMTLTAHIPKAPMNDKAVQISLDGRFHGDEGQSLAFVRPWTAPHEIKPPDEIVEEFRAQSRLLLARLEDEEKVCFPSFSDSDDEKEEEKGGGFGKTIVLGSQARDPDELVMDSLNVSISSTALKLKEAKMERQESQQRLRDLHLGIRLKEELIRELVKSGKEAEVTKRQYAEKLAEMERDVKRSKSVLELMRKKVEGQNAEDSAASQQLKGEYKKKLLTMQQKLAELQKRQKSSGTVAGLQKDNEKRLKEVEANLTRQRDEKEVLKKKLKKTADEKAKIEQELVTFQQQIKNLQQKTEQQGKMLKRKTEEAVLASRKLRQNKPAQDTDDAQTLKSKLLVQQQWLDGEVERVLAERETVKALERDIMERERVLKEREDVLAEKSTLEMKKLRSSQILSKDLLRVSVQLGSLEEEIQEKKAAVEKGNTPRGIANALRQLQRQRDELSAKQKDLEEDIDEGAGLDSADRQRLMELEEAIEALDAAIEFKNQEIRTETNEVKKEGKNVFRHLQEIPVSDLRLLLGQYFEKVVLLREERKEKDSKCSELKLNIEELEWRVSELQKSVRLSSTEAELRLTELQKEHEKEVQALLSQLNEVNAELSQKAATDNTSSFQAKIEELEKELYYYKMTSRDLKKKLREMSGSQDSNKQQPVVVKKPRKLLKELSSTDLASRPVTKSGVGQDAE